MIRSMVPTLMVASHVAAAAAATSVPAPGSSRSSERRLVVSQPHDCCTAPPERGSEGRRGRAEPDGGLGPGGSRGGGRARRAFGGALIFALPMLMTMEMWDLGGHAGAAAARPPARVALPLLVGVAHFIGFEATFGWREDVRDACIALGSGCSASASPRRCSAPSGRDAAGRDRRQGGAADGARRASARCSASGQLGGERNRTRGRRASAGAVGLLRRALPHGGRRALPHPQRGADRGDGADRLPDAPWQEIALVALSLLACTPSSTRGVPRRSRAREAVAGACSCASPSSATRSSSRSASTCSGPSGGPTTRGEPGLDGHHRARLSRRGRRRRGAADPVNARRAHRVGRRGGLGAGGAGHHRLPALPGGVRGLGACPISASASSRRASSTAAPTFASR